MSFTGRLVGAATIIGVASGSLLTGTALADPPSHAMASCMGHEASAVSPAGSESGPYSQHGMPGVLAFIDEVVIPLTGAKNRGGVISTGPAALKGLGSHEVCDEALGIPPGAE